VGENSSFTLLRLGVGVGGGVFVGVWGGFLLFL